MEIKEEELKELMLKAFKKGQEKYLAKDVPIKLWISEELNGK